MIILVQILVLFLVAIIVLVLRLRNKNWNFSISILLLCSCFFALLVNMALLKYIVLYDKSPVTITATKQYNGEAKGNEIFIKEIVVDGVSYHNYQIGNGKWVLKGNRLGWRSYDTSPDTSDSINLFIPEGKNRSIVFEKNQWRGFAIVSYQGGTSQVDFYDPSEKDLASIISLPSSSFSIVTGVFVLRFLLSCLVYLLFFIISLLFYKYQNRYNNVLSRYSFGIVCTLIALVAFGFMVKYSGLKSLWSDDMAQISFTYPGLSIHEMFNRLLKYDVQPPLFSVITASWLRVAPYGTSWVRLPSEIAVTIGIIICGFIGYKIQGRRTGILCAIFAASSSTLIIYAGYSLRPYSFFFLTSSLVLLTYIQLLKNIEKNINFRFIVIFGLVLTLMVYTHYFGILICGALFIGDFVLFSKKKNNIKFILPYIIAGTLFAPWAIIVMTKSIEKFSTFWPEKPSISSIIEAINYLSSENNIILTLLVVSIGILVIKLIYRNDRDFLTDYIQLLCLWTISFIIGITYVYSSVINPNRSVFVTRYFIGLLPFLLLFISIGLSYIGNLISENKNKIVGISLNTALYVALIFNIINITYPGVVSYQKQIYQPWEESANWLYQQPDIHNKNVLTILTAGWSDGWDYYLTHMNQRPKINREESANISEEKLKDITKVYLFTVHLANNIETQKLLDKYFVKQSGPDNLPVTIYVRK